MDEDKCFICGLDLRNGSESVVVSRGLRGLVAASLDRGDGKGEKIVSRESVTVHVACRKEYTRKSTIDRDKNRQRSADNLPDCDISKVSLRSSLPTFDFKADCVFCGREASEKKETKKSVKYRRVIYEVRTLVFKSTVRARCVERSDDWGRVVQARIDSVQDLVPAEAKYHTDCHLQFFAPTPSSAGRGRREDESKRSAFEKLREFMEDNDECQFVLEDLVKYMESFSSKSSYSRQYLREKLKAHYGSAIVITDIPGKSTVVNFKGTADHLLHEKWYSDRKKSFTDERKRIVETAAKIVREDIRRMMYNCDDYPAADQSSVTEDSIFPATLKLFLDTLITTRDPRSGNISRKRTALGQALISACRPRSFVPPVLLALGVFVHRRYASKQLIQILSSFGFCVGMAEVHRYEYSVLRKEHTAPSAEQYSQFCFDNADFNIRTLDGRNTFHCMGGIKCTAPKVDSEPSPVTRILEVPKASDIASIGKFKISLYRKPSCSGLKDIQIKELDIGALDSVVSASVMDMLWLSGRWARVRSPPSWNGYMKASVSAPVTPFHTTEIEALPFINLEPSNPSTIYSALKFASEQCVAQKQGSCFVIFDQPLYAKAVDIVASDTSGELQNVTVRLGGFHLLMSFLGAVGYVMSGSGIEELWAGVYAKSSVTHMISGHAYSRSLRAHFLTQQVIGTMVLDQLGDELASERDEMRSLFMKFMEHAVSVTDLLSSPELERLSRYFQDQLSSLSQKTRTGKLWIEYFQQSAEADQAERWLRLSGAARQCVKYGVRSIADQPERDGRSATAQRVVNDSEIRNKFTSHVTHNV